ncbi:MAG TPA: hypothetical protein VL523_13140 [Terriglobia bacterium]|nr:hypothetical protein [Terriglobia bacterium]
MNTAGLAVGNKNLRVRVSAAGPELHLRLEPDAAWQPAGPAGHSLAGDVAQRVGSIRVFSCESGFELQSWNVVTKATPEDFLRFFEVRDVNFDGYLDVAIVRESGAKWGTQTWWLFSPESGQFVSNDFTRALGQVRANGLELDAAHSTIVAPHLTSLTGCGGTRDIYRVEQSRRLVLIHKEDVGIQPDGCTLTTSDRVSGGMRVTKVQHFPPSHEAARR